MSEAKVAERRYSIRRRLLIPIIASLIAYFAVDSYYSYHEMLRSINTAYDRTLLASARAIGDGVKFAHETITVALPYPALEVFEADTRSRMVFRVSGFSGEFVSGYRDLPVFRGETGEQPPYSALVTFYEDEFRGEPVRVAALLQPVAVHSEYKMVVVQVAETLELRKHIAQQSIGSALLRQLLLIVVLSLVVWWVVGRGLSPLLRLRQEVLTRDSESLSPFSTNASRELSPVVEALNELMSRLGRVLENRQRFVRDASHQLRTPLAVLKIQVQNVRQGFVEPYVGLAEIESSVDRATRVANQMLSLAKVAELGDGHIDLEEGNTSNIVAVATEIAVECSPLISAKRIEFELDGDIDRPITVNGAGWLLRELLRNLLSNAIRYTPEEHACGVYITAEQNLCKVYVWDAGAGLAPEFSARLFQPFSTGDRLSGTGLGLVICQDICVKINATLSLGDRAEFPSSKLPLLATGCVARVVLTVVPSA